MAGPQRLPETFNRGPRGGAVGGPLKRSLAFLAPALALAAGTVLLALAAPPADADAVLSNGEIMLGVTDNGALVACCGSPSASGTTLVGLRDAASSLEGVAPGCACEGWGVSGGGASGARGRTVWPPAPAVSFTSTNTTATSVDQVGDLRVTHAFFPSAVPDLYQVDVTVANTGADAMPDVRYRRAADFDAEPTPFQELMTLDGAAVPGPLLESNDNGFCSPDPTASCGAIQATGPPASRYYTDEGPADHGVMVTFGLGALPAGGAVSFTLYYGVSASESDAEAAVAAVGAQMWSFAQSLGNGATGTPATFVFAVAPMDHIAPSRCAMPASPAGLSTGSLPPTVVTQLLPPIPVPGVRDCLPAQPCAPLVAATPVGGLDLGERDWAGEAGGPAAAADACLERPTCLKGGARVAVLGLRILVDWHAGRAEAGPSDGGPSRIRFDPSRCL